MVRFRCQKALANKALLEQDVETIFIQRLTGGRFLNPPTAATPYHLTVENHHNFAWKEMYEGKEVIVHRKSATPAGKDVLVIIPVSMTAPGFIVKGKGESASLNSPSHSAGRKMSRTKALSNITHEALKKELTAHGVKLIGGGLDEAPFAYKDINEVMQSQTTLVDGLGKFYPVIVQMDGSDPKKFRKRRDEVAGE